VNGDAFIKKALANIYTKKKYIKGVAFPTSISVNEICGHNAPINSEDSKEEQAHKVLTEGDVVKIDLGVQIQGFPAVVAHTIVVSEKDEVVTGKSIKVNNKEEKLMSF
jgi:methionine aminopeptidase